MRRVLCTELQHVLADVVVLVLFYLVYYAGIADIGKELLTFVNVILTVVTLTCITEL